MTLNIEIPKVNALLNEDNIRINLEKYFSEIANDWWKNQVSWNNEAYSIFKDHEKYLIVIYLIKKTLDTYATKLKKYSLNQFYSKSKIELEKFNIIEVSNYFVAPKETTRRKLIELEKDRTIIKNKKNTILNTTIFNFNNQINSIKKISTFLSTFSKILKKNKLTDKIIEAEIISKYIEKEFTYCWKLYYELQLEISNNMRGYFTDFETYHIWGMCVVNKSYNYPNNIKKYQEQYANFIIKGSSEGGLNAMTISDMTGIPRATVVRKLKKLIINKHLILDKNKRYHPSGFHLKKIIVLQKNNIKKLAEFITKILNQVEN